MPTGLDGKYVKTGDAYMLYTNNAGSTGQDLLIGTFGVTNPYIRMNDSNVVIKSPISFNGNTFITGNINQSGFYSNLTNPRVINGLTINNGITADCLNITGSSNNNETTKVWTNPYNTFMNLGTIGVIVYTATGTIDYKIVVI